MTCMVEGIGIYGSDFQTTLGLYGDGDILVIEMVEILLGDIIKALETKS